MNRIDRIAIRDPFRDQLSNNFNDWEFIKENEGDGRLGCAEIKVIYNANFRHGKKRYLPRDMAGITLHHNSKAELFIVMTSVQDDAIPTVMNSVYAHLILSGWRVTKQETGLDYTARGAGKVASYMISYGTVILSLSFIAMQN
ncbi:hypothetical protein HMPREF1544_06622 [Mucor circinelloides 1006PhL]|uniref:Uncharacterized protein n=1 Tax=Mucor circinelloides f. circinelloides (strain 1006PhL) TaxID=1220926 RepID=S2JUS9_MUCC1|nr:hypothetical protein HMPREF1544_06622 [Mucor circinelloides 1006PhL]